MKGWLQFIIVVENEVGKTKTRVNMSVHQHRWESDVTAVCTPQANAVDDIKRAHAATVVPPAVYQSATFDLARVEYLPSEVGDGTGADVRKRVPQLKKKTQQGQEGQKGVGGVRQHERGRRHCYKQRFRTTMAIYFATASKRHRTVKCSGGGGVAENQPPSSSRREKIPRDITTAACGIAYSRH